MNMYITFAIHYHTVTSELGYNGIDIDLIGGLIAWF